MFGISSWELVIIALFVLLAFGPDKIPDIFKLLGKAMKMFREAKSQVEEVTAQIIRPEDLETLKGLSDPLGARELKNNVATLLDPLKNQTVIDRQKEVQAAAADASSIWSSLAAPASAVAGNNPAEDAQPGVPSVRASHNDATKGGSSDADPS